ncbi:MAG: adenylate/guanylate cyclase domain-containing protein [Nitrospinota bacterium]|nr:adenylate/guanylate cyclase domain-containing protein [Nitrospinota bacterium]
MKKSAEVLVTASATALVAVMVALGLGRLDMTRNFSLKALDWQFVRLANPTRVDKNIVLIEVDQASLDLFENDNIAWPWPRSLYNPIIEYATEGGAKMVLFDILFTNLAPNGYDVDLDFAASIRKSGRVGLAAAFGAGRKNAEMDLDRFAVPFDGPPPQLMKKPSVVSLPMEEMLGATAGIGDVRIFPGLDGIYRRVPLGVIRDGRLFPSLFAIPILRGASEPVKFSDEGLMVDGQLIPLDREGKMMVNFMGPQGSYRSYSAANVIISSMMATAGSKPQIPQSAFKDAYVIIGYTAPGLYDLKSSPVSANTPGMAINAAALDTVISEKFIVPLSGVQMAGLMFLGALVICLALFFLPWTWAMAAGLANMAGLAWISAAAFESLVWIDLVALESSAILAVTISSLWKYQTEGKQKREIRKAFSYYVSPNVVNQMLAEPERLKLGGERRELTILFSDLEGFTTFSEKLDPKDLFSLMNRFTTMMADTITEFDGAVDKYIGDAVMAFWNAPLDQEGHQAKACLAALTCRRRLMVMRQELLARGMPPVDMRTGLNTGLCMVGNMGSAHRFNYSALGDPVNLASRLEGMCKAYGVGSLVAEVTWKGAAGKVFGREIDYLMVKGKEKPTRVFEILAAAGEETEEQARLVEEYTRLLELYRARRWKDVERNAEATLERVKDGPTWTLLTRVRHYMDTESPPDDWDGSFRHTTK